MKFRDRPDDRPAGENVNPAGSETDSASIKDVAAATSVSSTLPNTVVATSACSRPVARFASAADDVEMFTLLIVRTQPCPATHLPNT